METAMPDEKETPEPNILLKVAGKHFRCDCGCNVFNKPKPVSDPGRYVCNACAAEYTAG